MRRTSSTLRLGPRRAEREHLAVLQLASAILSGERVVVVAASEQAAREHYDAAVRVLAKQRSDASMFGFAAINADGERIDPAELMPPETKRVIDAYREQSSVPIGWPSSHR